MKEIQMQTLINEIIETEWDMFQNVNDEIYAECQTNRNMFDIMRKAQFEQWSLEALNSYKRDLENAVSEGRNLLREKYIHMMASTSPDEYSKLKAGLPDEEPEKESLIDEIWDILLEQTKKMWKEFPNVARFARPLLKEADNALATSIETYQKGELKTYSVNTLKCLLEHIQELRAAGISYAYKVEEATILKQGFADMDDAEKRVQSRCK